MAQVLLFDVNETLLDLAALDPIFERVMGDRTIRREWFQTLKEIWLIDLALNRYHDFGALGRAALRMTAERREVNLSQEDESAIFGKMRELPPHPEVAEVLEQMAGAGFRLAALTNGTLQAAQAQLKHARLAPQFEQIFSADEVQQLKPGPEPYRMAAQRLGVAIEEIRMIAAHDWDVNGASAAGCATAFVARPGQVLNPAGTGADLTGRDLQEVAQKILQQDRAG